MPVRHRARGAELHPPDVPPPAREQESRPAAGDVPARPRRTLPRQLTDGAVREGETDEAASDGVNDVTGLPPVGPPTISAHWAGLPAPLATPPVHHDVDPFDSGHRPREVLVETFIAAPDHDQEPETGPWPRARRP